MFYSRALVPGGVLIKQEPRSLSDIVRVIVPGVADTLDVWTD